MVQRNMGMVIIITTITIGMIAMAIGTAAITTRIDWCGARVGERSGFTVLECNSTLMV